MVNKLVSDSFETLGDAAKSATVQVKQIVKQIGDDAAESLGLKPQTDQGTSEQNSQQAQQKAQDDQLKKQQAQQNAQVRKRYQQLQGEIKQIQAQRNQEMVKYSQPGFTDEEKQQKQIQQLQEKKEDKLPPLPVQRASKKTESMRGASG